jgi:hypothetical protein
MCLDVAADYTSKCPDEIVLLLLANLLILTRWSKSLVLIVLFVTFQTQEEEKVLTYHLSR